MNRLEHGTNPNYKYIVSDNPELYDRDKALQDNIPYQTE